MLSGPSRLQHAIAQSCSEVRRFLVLPRVQFHPEAGPPMKVLLLKNPLNPKKRKFPVHYFLESAR